MIRNSNCLKSETIQLYIDNELEESARKIAEQHIALCSDCTLKINEMADWVNQVKHALKERPVASFEFQEFKLTEKSLEKKSLRVWVSPVLKIAALFIFIFGGYFLFQKEQSKIYQPSSSDLLIWEETSGGNDANHAWHDRQITILITDEKGKINYLNVN